MKKFFLILIFFLQINFVFGYNNVGSDSTLDVLTWNIEWFPKNGNTTITEIQVIISDLNVDLIAVQEIASIDDFNTMLAGIPGWSGILSSHEYGDGSYQKVGLMYKESVVTVNSYQLLFEDEWYYYPRPAMELAISTTEGENTFEFKLIVLHLKAYSDLASEERRRQALIMLKDYIDIQVAQGIEDEFIVLGDYNDQLEDPTPTPNVFTYIINDEDNYTFLTLPIAGIESSYIPWTTPSLIDHILITKEARAEYGDDGTTHVLYLDDQNSNFEDNVSDHRPVYGRFTFSGEDTTSQTTFIPIYELHEEFSQYENTIVNIKGVVTLGTGILSDSYTSAYVQDSSEAGICIYKNGQVIAGLQRGNKVEIKGRLIEYSGLHEIEYISYTLVETSVQTPEPYAVSTGNIQDISDQGNWVKVTGTIISHPGTSGYMQINDGSGTGNIYFDPDAGLNIFQWQVGDSVRIEGVKSVYNNNGQIVPGYQEHLEKIEPDFINNIDGNFPNTVTLLGNYPNPFNP
ncbi:MAG: endonuclease/exonuclease/phosphatase family protein, partial [Calditrichia bacterium]|nr:endonuclease/exonuclease/phosphatase family protein [Calditrichia bacterium]